MKQSVRILLVAALAGAFSVAAAPAQSTTDQQTPPAPQSEQSQPNQDQSTGVAHPPPDSTIQADEDLNPPPPPPAQPSETAKPSAAIPATPSNAPLAVNRAPVSASVASAIIKDSVIAGSSPFSGEVDNTDSGIVTVVPGPGSAPPLEQRTSSGGDDIVSYVPVNPNDLSPGTNISVRLSQPLSTENTNPGTPFRATVAHDVYNGTRVIIPAGAEMRGRVVYVSQGHHFGIHASLRLRPEVILLPDGTTYHIYADVVHSSAAGTKATDEGAIQATNHYGKDGLEYGGTMGTGAVVGGVVGGPVGAGVGTLVGAGVVTAHLLLQDPRAAQLPQGTELVFSLTQPMALTPTKN